MRYNSELREGRKKWSDRNVKRTFFNDRNITFLSLANTLIYAEEKLL